MKCTFREDKDCPLKQRNRDSEACVACQLSDVVIQLQGLGMQSVGVVPEEVPP